MAKPWRVAKSLLRLRDQINFMSPSRSKVSDGTIGNAEHSSRQSDHNPNPARVVTAMDITHDPAHGVDTQELAEQLREGRDSRIDYVISFGKIFSSSVSPWQWRPYKGKNPHNHHIHISVKDEVADKDQDWNVETYGGGVVDTQPERHPFIAKGTKGKPVVELQQFLGITDDGIFGPATERAVKAWQKANGLIPDGKVGPYTWEAMEKSL